MSSFPDKFLWGATTSSYQIEGFRDADGAGESVWDVFTRQPGVVEGGGDGSRALGSYADRSREIAHLKELGAGAYRFSVGWSRVMPKGTGAVNQLALDHYDRFVDNLLREGIEPVVTLNHWDMPQALMNVPDPLGGGWISRSSVDAFGEYTAAVSERIGDRVTYWITQNEPWIVQLLGYQVGIHAPGVADLSKSFAAGHHILLGHGRAADILHAHNPAAQVSSALSLFPCDPATLDPADIEAAWGSDGYVNRWYLDPLYGKGYPKDMMQHWESALSRENAPFAIDEIIRPGDVDLIGNRMDYLAVNYYTRRVCATAPVNDVRPFPWAVVGPPGDVDRTTTGWEVIPESLERLLVRLDEDYGSPKIMITENGAPSPDVMTHDGQIHDNRRIFYLRGHLKAIENAISRGVDVFGYLHWSLLDNFEWALGYGQKFGLVHVDYVTGKQTLKDSGHFYREVIASGKIPEDDPLVNSFG